MSVLFFDTSAVVKRYVRETGTNWIIKQLRQPTADVFVANVTGIETVAAITRRKNDSSLTAFAADKALRRFQRENSQDENGTIYPCWTPDEEFIVVPAKHTDVKKSYISIVDLKTLTQ